MAANMAGGTATRGTATRAARDIGLTAAQRNTIKARLGKVTTNLGKIEKLWALVNKGTATAAQLASFHNLVTGMTGPTGLLTEFNEALGWCAMIGTAIGTGGTGANGGAGRGRNG